MTSLSAVLLVAAVQISAADVAQKVQRAYEKTRDLSAKFEQVTILKSAGREGPKSHGKVYFQKPGKMRWEFSEGNLFVTDGSTLWQFDEEEELVTVNQMAKSAGVTAVNFLAGMGSLTESFDVRLATPRGEPDDRAVFLSLKPKPGQDISLGELVVRVDKKKWLVRVVYMQDMLGNETRIEFAKLKTNRGLKASLFRFEPPEGVEVLDAGLME